MNRWAKNTQNDQRRPIFISNISNKKGLAGGQTLVREAADAVNCGGVIANPMPLRHGIGNRLEAGAAGVLWAVGMEHQAVVLGGRRVGNVDEHGRPAGDAGLRPMHQIR